MLGFESFVEAFNVVGYALGARPASIKNYRDEFDPLFPNNRQGWHKRPTRDYCLTIYEQYKNLDISLFTGLVKSFLGYDEDSESVVQVKRQDENGESAFAKRLVTGLAAENYFESVYSDLPEFKDYSIENTTRWGCGYDFRFTRADTVGFLAVEVKGLREQTGSLALTPKEYEAAKSLEERFFLFVVKNFRESPFHDIHGNPLAGPLRFTRKETVVVQVAWLTTV